MEAEARARITQLQDALQRNPKEARAILSAIFDGKLTATPVTDQRGTRFVIEGVASVGRMLAYERESSEGVSNPPPQKFASPRGVATLARIAWRPALGGNSAATQLWPELKMRIAL